MAINTLSGIVQGGTGAAKKGGGKKNKPKPKPKPRLTGGARALNFQNLYQEAVRNGTTKEFLLAHPKWAAKMNLAPNTLNNIQDPGVQGVLKDEKNAVASQSGQDTLLSNPGTSVNALGTKTDVTTDPQGRPIVSQTLSDPNAAILAGGQANTIAGQKAAGGLIEGYTKFDKTGSPEERARIEEEAYKRLTRNVDRDFNQEFDAMEQRMYNRGIPLDPNNPAYKREMDSLNEKYTAVKENAAQNATVLGRGEAESSFNMGQASHQQGISDIASLGSAGSGFNVGDPVAFNAPNVAAKQTPAGTVALTLAEIEARKKIAETQANATMAAANAAASGGGSEEEDDTSNLS